MAKIGFTAGRVDGFKCPPGKTQAFLWDDTAPGLGLRATPAGKPAYIFQGVYQGKTIRLTIGNPDAWNIVQAREKAKAMQRLIDDGKDPRDLKRDALAEKAREAAAAAAMSASEAANAVTVGDVWPRYLEEGKPKRRDAWKPGYLASLKEMAAAGGVKKKRGEGLTRSGPIYPLLALALGDVTEDSLQVWFEREAKTSKHQAARALMMFRGFLRWCAARPEYRKLIDRDAGKAPAILENLPTNSRRTDAIESAQMSGWWQGVEQLSNRTASAYLKALLLTGARKEELATLTWANVDFQWRKLTIADKVEQTRTIPLTPYLAQLLATLKRENEYVFASPSKVGRISDVRSSHAKVLKGAGIDHLTIHGLRRTFIQRARAVVPAGVPAQIAGQKPSAVAEGYAVLAIDDLRTYAVQVEAYILGLAGVQFDAEAEPGKLVAVK
jgi:integrase